MAPTLLDGLDPQLFGLLLGGIRMAYNKVLYAEHIAKALTSDGGAKSGILCAHLAFALVSRGCETVRVNLVKVLAPLCTDLAKNKGRVEAVLAPWEREFCAEVLGLTSRGTAPDAVLQPSPAPPAPPIKNNQIAPEPASPPKSSGQPQQTFQAFCAECGMKLSADGRDKFCQQCGTPVDM